MADHFVLIKPAGKALSFVNLCQRAHHLTWTYEVHLKVRLCHSREQGPIVLLWTLLSKLFLVSCFEAALKRKLVYWDVDILDAFQGSQGQDLIAIDQT